MARTHTIMKTQPTSIHRSNRSDFFIPKPAQLTLSDGTIFYGSMPEWQTGPYMGEAVFNTGMTGYVESLTDPSYAGQLLIFTYPLIGNYGVDPAYFESDKIHLSGVIVSELAPHWSHDKATSSLLEWLKNEGVPVITGIDTRALTKHLRVQGTMPAAISAGPIAPQEITTTPHFVTTTAIKTYNPTEKKTIILVDCGLKENIVRSLQRYPIKIVRVPRDYDYTTMEYDGVFLSNGPGDPENYHETIRTTKAALATGKPIFGICLGSQIMGLAAGARTYKLPFGHRGHNQPCLEQQSSRGYITSQNHSYAIDETSLPRGWRVSFRNLNDGSVEGIKHSTKPFYSVQFHPEACPGPTDTEWLFERFYQSL